MSEKVSVLDLRRYAESTIKMTNELVRACRRPLFRSHLDRDDLDFMDMHFRAIGFVQPHVENLLERLRSGEDFENVTAESGPVDTLDILVGSLEEYFEN